MHAARRRVHQADAAEHLSGLLADKEIELVTEFNTGEVDGVGGSSSRTTAARSTSTSPSSPSAPRRRRLRRALTGARRRARLRADDTATLQAEAAPNVFVIGDATNLPTSKAGSVTHFEAEALVENVARYLAGEPLEAGYDGHANCFIETGFHKALLIDFNYDIEPVPGHYPTAVGLPLLKESRLNHLGKLPVPVRLLARAAARSRPPRPRPHDAHRRQATPLTPPGGLTCRPPPSPTPPSTSTTKASSPTEQWTEDMARRSPARTASTS